LTPERFDFLLDVWKFFKPQCGWRLSQTGKFVQKWAQCRCNCSKIEHLFLLCYDSQIELVPWLGERQFTYHKSSVKKWKPHIQHEPLGKFETKIFIELSNLVGFILFWHLTLKEQISKFKLSLLKVHLRWQSCQHCRQWYSSASNCSSTQIGFFCSGATQTCVAFIIMPHGDKAIRNTAFDLSRWNFANANIALPSARGRLSTVDPIIKVACFVKKVNYIFNLKKSWSKLVSTRRLTVLSLPLQIGFLALVYSSFLPRKETIGMFRDDIHETYYETLTVIGGALSLKRVRLNR